MSATSQQPLELPEQQWIRCLQTMTVCARKLRRKFADALGATGISDNEFYLLWYCQLQGGRTVAQNRLPSLLAVSPAQLSTTIDSLLRRHLVEAMRDTDDRRRQTIRITDDGQRTLGEAIAQLTSLSQYFDRRVNLEEQSELLKHLNRLNSELENLRVFTPPVEQPAAQVNKPEEQR